MVLAKVTSEVSGFTNVNKGFSCRSMSQLLNRKRSRLVNRKFLNAIREKAQS